ncbi:MAG: 23S rRNA (guanosine(2251)-2'-O)-methyltransferase RlmB [Hyphomicrobiaceae bacterium]
MPKRPKPNYYRNAQANEPRGRSDKDTENRQRRGHDEVRGDGAETDGPTLIFGVHAAEAALRNPARVIRQVFVTENGENRLKDAVSARNGDGGLKLTQVTPRDLDRRLGADTVHQGILLECDPLPEPSLEQLADLPDSSGPLLVLDQVTDPHNVGAILRSAAVFGAQGVMMTRRHSPPLGGVLAKSASGALEHVPIILVPNLARALDELGSLAYFRVGLDGTGDQTIEEVPLGGRVALVLGAEGRGLRQLTREHCDVLARISGSGPLASLNVSNAAAVSLHLAAMRRRATPVKA